MTSVQGRVHMKIGGLTLIGYKRAGKWMWLFQGYSELAMKHSGKEEPDEMIADFLAIAAGQTPRLALLAAADPLPID